LYFYTHVGKTALRPTETKPAASTDRPFKLSVVVPLYREGARISATPDDLIPALLLGPRAAEIVLVDDGSPDETVGMVMARVASR
jgi:hypothetical protein